MKDKLMTEASTQKKNLFFVSAFLCVAVPGFAAVKALVIILLWLYMAITIPLRTQSLLWLASVALNIILCSEVAFLHNVPMANTTDQLSRILLFFLVLGSAAFISDTGSFTAVSTDRLILAISLVSVLLKITITILLIRGTVSLQAIQTGLGFETVTVGIGFGLQRLQFPSDIALIFLIACYTGGRRKLIDALFLMAVTISIVLSFSRFLFAAYVACLAIRCLRVRRFDQVSAVALSVALLLGAIFSVSIASRFSTQVTGASDTTRTEQIKFLNEVIEVHPFLGTGIGSSVNGYKRSQSMPFSYEVQWYAMVMQLGVVGLTWFLVNMLAPLSRCLRAPVRSGIFLCVLLVWVLAGFTNPLIVSLGSAFGLGILMLVLTKDEFESVPWRRFPEK